MDYCIGCGEELCILDEDPNGDIGAVCARCEAEEDHDWDEYPDVEFDRSGEMIYKNDKLETKPGFIQIGDTVVNKTFIIKVEKCSTGRYSENPAIKYKINGSIDEYETFMHEIDRNKRLSEVTKMLCEV